MLDSKIYYNCSINCMRYENRQKQNFKKKINNTVTKKKSYHIKESYYSNMGIQIILFMPLLARYLRFSLMELLVSYILGEVFKVFLIALHEICANKHNGYLLIISSKIFLKRNMACSF